MTPFERALAFTLQWEGGFTDNPADPGGATNKGVTQAEYNAWRKDGGHAPRDVRAISANKAEVLYAEDYWKPAGCSDLRWPLCLLHFDTAVNLGVTRAKHILDAAHRDVDSYLFQRRNYYTGLVNSRPKLAVFLKGWLNRVAALEAETKKREAA